MLTHYLKIAFRNLAKYKMQNIISVIGLAIGFACFAFSALWIRYEMNYDSFHANSDRIYRVHIMPFRWDPGAANAMEVTNSPAPLAAFLKATFPEIEDAGVVIRTFRSVEQYEFQMLLVDYSISNMFDMNLREDFFDIGVWGRDRPVAVIPKLFTDEVRELVEEQMNHYVRTTVPHWSPNTNLPFNMVAPVAHFFSEANLAAWNTYYQGVTPLLIRAFEIYVLVHPNVNMRALQQRLDRFDVPGLPNPMSVRLTPITSLRYADPTGVSQQESEIQFTHIRIFAIAGLLVILSSLFNHLNLFVTRVRMRLRELALRKVNGATNGQIAVTIYFDFLLVILFSLIVGFILMALLLPAFRELAGISSTNVGIYGELGVYAALLIVCGLIAGAFPVLFAQRQVLNECIKGGGSPGSKNTFRKVSLLVQLIISVAMVFCAFVFIKQIRFLHNTDLGIDRHNIVTVMGTGFQISTHYADLITAVPGVVDAIPISRGTLRPNHSGSFPHTFTDEAGNTATYNLFILIADNRFFDFFGVQIIEGRNFENDYVYEFLLNETAMRDVGEFERQRTDVLRGVFRDFYLSPTQRPRATKAHFPTYNRDGWMGALAYRYVEGTREQTERAVEQWIRENIQAAGERAITFTYVEDVFNEAFESERQLMRLLWLLTLVCVLIAIFGVYSLTRLTCQQRRKEIAIRKVNGAEVFDIMNIFFKEYLILFGIASAVAFPIGYIVMRRWLEEYVRQTPIEFWVYVLIFLVMFAVIVLSILHTVWKAANQNPAEVVKSG